MRPLPVGMSSTCALAASLAAASTIRVTMEGEIDSVDPALASFFSPGDPVSWTFELDTSQPDNAPQSNSVGSYPGSVVAISGTLGSYAVAAGDQSLATTWVYDNALSTSNRDGVVVSLPNGSIMGTNLGSHSLDSGRVVAGTANEFIAGDEFPDLAELNSFDYAPEGLFGGTTWNYLQFDDGSSTSRIGWRIRTLEATSETSTASFYASGNQASSTLFLVDADTGLSSTVGDTGLPLGDLALAPDGTLYASTSAELYVLSRDDGQPSLVGSFGGPEGMVGLELASDGRLLGATSDGTVWEIDPSTGAATSVMATGFLFHGDIAFGPDGFLYGSGSVEFGDFSELIRVELGVGATSLGTIAPSQFILGLDFDSSERLIAAEGLAGDVYEVPNYPIDGTGSFLSSSGVPTGGLTLPEPSSGVMLWPVIALFALRLRRRA